MTTSEIELLRILADGELYSGQYLANKVGVSRTAIWKQINKIKEKNVKLIAIRGKGYQLEYPLELLNVNKIRDQLTPIVLQQLESIQVLYQTDSTNKVLMDALPNTPIHARVVLAEYQSNGRGRGTNKWMSAPGMGLCISIAWHFDYMPKSFSALSLATGVVLANSLCQGEDGNRIQLKWPNDLIYNNAKLGGILIETRGQHAGSVDVVIGIGINININTQFSCLIDQKVTDLSTVYGNLPPRNYIASIIINNIFNLLAEYPQNGFEKYIGDWHQLDISKGKKAVLHSSGKKIVGTVNNIDDNGNLVMVVNGKKVKFSSGDLSLRLKK
jgi:BirA family transcriptional regulator, biotin operon repressor / biotin---[acetyl-CoA-carboxylase] ligase